MPPSSNFFLLRTLINVCHWHGSSCQPSWLLYCCRKHLVQLHAELTPWAELWEHSLYQLSVARWLRPTCFAATPSVLGWVSHFQWSNTNTGNYFYFSLSVKEIFITFNFFFFFFWRMIRWLGKDAWRSLINYLWWLFLTAFGTRNFSFVYWNRISTSACMSHFFLWVIRETWCYYHLPLWETEEKRQIPSDVLQLHQKIMALSATKTEFNKFQTSVFNTKSASLIFCFYVLAQ